jgi:hypothetical protein
VSALDGDLKLTAGGNLSVDSTVVTDAGQIDLKADDNFSMGAVGRLTSSANHSQWSMKSLFCPKYRR